MNSQLAPVRFGSAGSVRAGLRHSYALAYTCHGIGERILNLIEQTHATIATAAGPIEHPLQKVVD
jgi:hypothetical protein